MNELQKIINEIQYRTQKTIDQIAKDINYRGNYLSSAIKKGESVGLKDVLIDKYRDNLIDYFKEEEPQFLLMEDPADSIKQSRKIKLVDFEKLMVHDMILAKAMLRVLLRNQAEIIAAQRKVKVSVVLNELTRAVRAETSEEFDEL